MTCVTALSGSKKPGREGGEALRGLLSLHLGGVLCHRQGWTAQVRGDEGKGVYKNPLQISEVTKTTTADEPTGRCDGITNHHFIHSKHSRNPLKRK